MRETTIEAQKHVREVQLKSYWSSLLRREPHPSSRTWLIGSRFGHSVFLRGCNNYVELIIQETAQFRRPDRDPMAALKNRHIEVRVAFQQNRAFLRQRNIPADQYLATKDLVSSKGELLDVRPGSKLAAHHWCVRVGLRLKPNPATFRCVTSERTKHACLDINGSAILDICMPSRFEFAKDTTETMGYPGPATLVQARYHTECYEGCSRQIGDRGSIRQSWLNDDLIIC